MNVVDGEGEEVGEGRGGDDGRGGGEESNVHRNGGNVPLPSVVRVPLNEGLELGSEEVKGGDVGTLGFEKRFEETKRVGGSVDLERLERGNWDG